MAPADLLRPLEGQREETLRLLGGLQPSDLDAVHRGTGWSIRQIVAHLASAELGECFLIRRALEGEQVHMTPDERDQFNEAQVDGAQAMSLADLTALLAEARESLRELFGDMADEDLDCGIRWPEWPARTIRTSIPYMIEHEDSHLDQLREALGS